MDSAHEHGRWTLPMPASEPPGPVFGYFGPFWARSGPAMGPACSGARRPIAGGRRGFRGPKMLFGVPRPIHGGSGTPTGTFIHGPILGLPCPGGAGCCCLLARCRGSTYCPDHEINQQKLLRNFSWVTLPLIFLPVYPIVRTVGCVCASGKQARSKILKNKKPPVGVP